MAGADVVVRFAANMDELNAGFKSAQAEGEATGKSVTASMSDMGKGFKDVEEAEQALIRLGDTSVTVQIAPLKAERKAATDALYEQLINWRPLNLEAIRKT